MTLPLSFTVKKTYVDGGILLCDVERLGTPAQSLVGVPVLAMGGGSRGFIVGPDVGASVLIGYTADGYSFPTPFIMGAWVGRGMDLSPNEQQSEDQTSNADPTLDAASVPIQNAGAQVVLDRYGAIRATPASGQPFRAELTGSGEMAVTLDGDASDRVTVTGPLVTLLLEYQAAIVELQVKVAILQAAAATPPIPDPTSILPDPPTVPTSNLIGSAVLRVSPATPDSAAVDPTP